MFPARIETERLTLVPRSPEHVDPLELYEVCSAPSMAEVTAQMAWDPHVTPSESLDSLERGRKRRQNGEAAEYVVLVDGEVAGMTGMKIDWARKTGQFGLWLAKAHWGNGYSGERAAALAALAFDHLDLACLRVGHGQDNDQSRRAVEKYVERFGGRKDGTVRNEVPFPDDPVRDEVQYSVSAEEWAASGVDPDVTFEW